MPPVEALSLGARALLVIVDTIALCYRSVEIDPFPDAAGLPFLEHKGDTRDTVHRSCGHEQLF